MFIRPNLVVVEEEYVPAAVAAGSAEPFRRADHKAKRHSRPRGGHVCRRRHDAVVFLESGE